MSNMTIDNLKQSAIASYKQALSLFGNNQLIDACAEFKKLIALAEQIYHHTNSDNDLEFLIKNYLEISKCYHLMYKTSNNKNDLFPSCLYYEKSLYLCEEKLQTNNEIKKEELIKVMEMYVQLLWTYLELKNYKSYNNFKKKAKKNAKKLIKISNTFEDQQYLLLIMIFEADYLKITNKLRRSYVLYSYVLSKLKQIYISLPQEGVKNDLITIYKNLIEISTKLNKIKLINKWEAQLKEIGGK